MNAKDLLGKKIIDKNAKDLAKLAEIDINIKTFTISKIYGSIGNPISKKYYDITSDNILAVGDYIQVAETADELEGKLLDKIPESEENRMKINNLIGKTVLNSEGNITGKVVNLDIDLTTFKINGLSISNSSSTFGKPKNEAVITQEDILGIGDYIIINKTLNEEKEEESDDSVNVDIN
ncbi:MAG: hypothetical protein BZ135_06715 [Methanosphaera sp. rholeuAM6]|nr:MAG: hypothetical protein BZ135_06715 [Methanosphaera sp. rholeuAM6]